MKITKLPSILFCAVVLSLAAGFLFAPAVSAETAVAGLSYPVAELGGCQDQAACKAYCDQPDNMSACVDFSLSQGIIKPEEATVAKKAIEKIKSGQTPGNCRSREECANYCQGNPNDLKMCIAFAEEIGLPGEEIAQAKQVAAALEKGASLPGNCQGKAACEAYCGNNNHIDECLAFAEAAEILPATELAEAKKIVKFIKNGEMPGGCQNKSDCQVYCAAEANFEECINFAEKAELISKEELELARKTGGKGPGGCKSKVECQAYCDQEENVKTCTDFAVEKGLLSQAEMENIKSGVDKIKTGLEQIPPEIKNEVEVCLNNLFGGKLAEVLSGQQALTSAQGNQVGACFEEAAGRYASQQQEQMQSQAGQTGSASQPPSQEQIQQMMQGAPEEIKNQIQEQINQQIQERTQQEMLNNMPLSAPQNMPSAQQDAPDNAGSAPLIPPVVENMPVEQVPSGIQGPPCNSPEECRAMFGSSAPSGIPQ